MNVADLTSILVLLVGVSSGVAASETVGAQWWVSLLCGVIGLLLGFLADLPLSKAAYKLLELDNVIAFIGYLILPLVRISAVGAIVYGGAILILD